ncbi:MAG: DNA-3-methyladenine glycosylase [Desulfurococcales archaeon]|nr:DNA-3-methyladenine glycosylase [Desulfurococcales archaeon]
MLEIILQHFYNRDPAIVARELLGKLLVRIIDGIRLSGYIVETEAYYGPEDPASRARRGGDLARTMRGAVGYTLIYGIHRQWLLNIVAHPPECYGAVLIRAIEPLGGIEYMMRYRGRYNIHELTNGPGRLTRALRIDKSLHRKPVFKSESLLRIEKGIDVDVKDIAVSYRIGVSKDLDRPLRFYIRGNKFVSKK